MKNFLDLPKCKSVDECEFKLKVLLDKRCRLIGECGDKVLEIDWDERRAKQKVERLKRFRDIGSKFNNLFLQFNAFHDEAVSYGCSLLSTPSVAAVYDVFLDAPHVYTFDQIIKQLHPRTIRKALKRLERFGVIIHDEDTKTWSLHLEKGADHR